jgi:hypothetical protein
VDQARVIEVTEHGDQPKPLTKQEIVPLLRAEFGGRFEVYHTAHYVICYNSDAAFARSCGSLFEKLHRAFTNYFKRRSVPVQPNEFPMVAVVFGSEHEFLQYARRELGDEMARNVIGYYSFLTNRMVLYDMQPGGARAGLGNIGSGRPGLGPRGIDAYTEANVATVIHEATHQLAYNSGFHRRFSDNPLWLAEGMAMFFESPNRQAAEWKGVGEINRPRWNLFHQEYLSMGRSPDIRLLLRDDDRLRDRRTALLGYAESWALTYFLMKTRPARYHDYLKILAEKPALVQDPPEQRLADFQSAFGTDLEKLEEDLMRYMRSLPAR